MRFSSQSRISFHNPDSWSLTNTEAEMCIADTSTNPSVIPAVARHASTSSVMSMMSCRFFVLNVRYEVCVFMCSDGLRQKRSMPGVPCAGTKAPAPFAERGHGEIEDFRVAVHSPFGREVGELVASDRANFAVTRPEIDQAARHDSDTELGLAPFQGTKKRIDRAA